MILFFSVSSLTGYFLYNAKKPMVSSSQEFGSQYSAPYCLAIRGNGELAPAHWGGISQIIERWGLPIKQAGGSSASLSMFLLDAVATNSEIRNHEDSLLLREKASFLVKSFLGTLLYIEKSPQVQTMISYKKKWEEMNASFEKYQTLDILNKIQTTSGGDLKKLIIQNKENLLRLNEFYTENASFLNEKAFNPFFSVMNDILKGKNDIATYRKIYFLAHELYQSISLFGAFNAKTDDNLFFREGILDFNKLAFAFGKVASFYAGIGMSSLHNEQFKNWLSSCSEQSLNKTWIEIIQKNPRCQQDLSVLLNNYFKDDYQEDKNFVKSEIGVTIPSYPTTSILKDRGATQAQSLLSDYERLMDNQFGKNHLFTEPQNVMFGYWGKDLDVIQKQLPADDEKSQRFFPLGNSSWQQAISLSPAEPGLARIQKFQNNGKTLFSAGGWSDLHPTLVLKASGCETVIYLQRKGGETFFGQGVAKRLLGYDRSWNYLEGTPENAKINNEGDASDRSSLWGRLYNLGNEKSSYYRSIQAADIVVCTDWNRWNLFKDGPVPMIEEAYLAPIIVNNKSNPLSFTEKSFLFTEEMSISEKSKWPGCAL